ncbi:MAG: hypothetical protein IPL92_13940 [Saprospiraceae bacterium]|nr:hypothetical protein [Candidatus Opimibacter iunctus]
MKSFFQYSFFALLFASAFLTGCEQDKCTRTEEFIAFEPVFKRIDEMRMPSTYVAPKSLTAPGKIFYYKGYLLINEMNQGIHVIDNRQPESPQNLGFIEIPGNLDMAVHNDVLYADSYLDLVAINITNPTAPVEVERVNDVFQNFYSFNDQLGYLVEYKQTDVKRTIDCSDANWGSPTWIDGGGILMSSDATFGGVREFSGSNISSSVVTGGSMARFTASDNYLYTIDGAEVKVFDIKQTLPVLKSEVAMQWGIETLFPMAGSLFVGSNSGVLIYDISNPEQPEYRSTFAHATACDPVVVSGNTAYVTLRDGNNCQGFVNQLDVIDVSNLDNPNLIRSYPMSNPHGLSVVDQTLYLCEGTFGLKTFDVADPKEVSNNLLDHLSGFEAFDVIVLPPGDHVMVVGKNGLYQFDATDRSDLKQLSVISIGL